MRFPLNSSIDSLFTTCTKRFFNKIVMHRTFDSEEHRHYFSICGCSSNFNIVMEDFDHIQIDHIKRFLLPLNKEFEHEIFQKDNH